jgi:hypothetical protein
MSEYFLAVLPKDYYSVQPNNIKFKCTLTNTILEACKNRSWKETEK